MSVKNLKHLFRPQSVAVVGASNRPRSVGALLMRNLLLGGFRGPIMPVNPKYEAVQGVLAYKDVDDLPVVPDLAVVSVPPNAVPTVVEKLAAGGTKAAIVVTAGLHLGIDNDGRTLSSVVLDIAARSEMRLLGPNCLGAIVPSVGLNASFAPRQAHPGRIAFVSQSGALCTAVLDWAGPKGIGFSHFVSLGDGVDIDFGDMLDYLGSDPDTSAILLYIESIRERRNFMSAARAAARNKPVLAIKAGRRSEGARAAQSHTGALAGSDSVYDAAMRRAGMLRVYGIDELFAAVETLALAVRPKGERLAILTNGGGIGVMAVDDLIDMGGILADLSQGTIDKLNTVLPPTWSHGNPVDIIGDATGARYADALNILTQAKEIDSILCMHAPVAVTDASEVAASVADVARQSTRVNVTTCWVGEEMAGPARAALRAAHIPTFQSPRQAVQAFMHMVQYRRNQTLLMETPPSLPTEFTPSLSISRGVITAAIEKAGGQAMLSEPDAKAVLTAYGIPTVETHIAETPEEATLLARKMGGPLALKIISPDITHKSDRGGVRLNLETAEEVEQAAVQMLKRLGQSCPHARIEGFSVQRMERRPGAHELILGVHTDPIFGPVILFGQGGTAVEVIADRAVALPPLNVTLARDLISQTRIFKLLQGYRDQPAADFEAICLSLIQVAQLVIDIPEITDLDINPLFADHQGVIALDARINVRPAQAGEGTLRLAIRPYPRELEEWFTMLDGSKVLLRPIRPEDEPKHHVLMSRLTSEDIRFRFFGLVHELPHSQMARLTQIDYDREMAFVATTNDDDSETLGVVRAVNDAEDESAEFSIIVRSDLKGSGLGKALMHKLIQYCRQRGIKRMIGQVLRDNARMLNFVDHLGFQRRAVPDPDVVEVVLDLQFPTSAVDPHR